MSEQCSIQDGATGVIDVPRLYAEQWHAMVLLAFLLTDSKSAAEDLVQDAFIALHKAAARVAEPGAALAYVRAAIVNRSRVTECLRRDANAKYGDCDIQVGSHQQVGNISVDTDGGADADPQPPNCLRSKETCVSTTTAG